MYIHTHNICIIYTCGYIHISSRTHSYTPHTHTETEGMGGVKGYMGTVVGEGWVEVMLMPYLYIKFSKNVNKKLHFLVTVTVWFAHLFIYP